MNIDYSQLLAGNEHSIDDMSLEVLRKLDDTTLANFCKTNKYYKNLCEKTIWPERIKAVPGLSLLLPYRSHYKDLEDFYFNVRNDAQYVIIYGPKNVSPQSVLITNDINKAYRRVLYFIGRLYGVDSKYYTITNELLGPAGEIWHIKITIRFNGFIDHDDLDKYTIFSINNGTPGYLNPDILSYPLLVDKDIYMAIKHTTPVANLPVQPDGRNNIEITTGYSFFSYDDNSLRNVHRLGKNIIAFVKPKMNGTPIRRDTFDIDNPLAGDDSLEFLWMLYGFIGNEKYEQQLLLADYSTLNMSPRGYQLVLVNGLGAVWGLVDMLTITPERLQQIMREDTMKLLKNGQIISRADLSSTLSSSHSY
jgi:hypothetical protein